MKTREGTSTMQGSARAGEQGVVEQGTGGRFGSRKGFGALALAAVLAGCGGGGGGGGDDGGGGGGGPPPSPCLSQVGGGSGYSVGSCINPIGARYLPVTTDVQVRGPASYLLTLDFPGDQPAGADTTVEFTSANRTTNVTESSRDILGVVRGEAYESPLNATLTPPFTALTDFSRGIHYESREPLVNLRYLAFGHWERVLQSFNDSYFGVWYSPRPDTSVVNTWPTAARTYQGRLIGVLSPTRLGDDRDFRQSYGFSANVELRTGASGRIEAGTVTDMVITYRPNPTGPLVEEPLQVNPLELTQATGDAPGGAVTGTLNAPGPLVTGTGEFEARWFGEQAAPAAEIGGRMRFTAGDGHYLVLGSFGAAAVSP